MTPHIAAPTIPTAIPDVDTVLDYQRVPLAGWGRCRLRLFHAPADGAGPLVLVTDLGDDNAGASVTNAAESIASAVVRNYALDPDRTRFVEHYDGRISGTATTNRRDGVEDFDRVAFTWATDGRDGTRADYARWSPLRKAAVEAILGGTLP